MEVPAPSGSAALRSQAATPCPALPARPFVPALRERRAAASFLLPSPPSCSRRGPTHAPRRDGTAQRLRSATARRDSNPRPSTPRPPPPPPRRALTRRPPSQRCPAPSGRRGERRDPPHCTALHCLGKAASGAPSPRFQADGKLLQRWQGCGAESLRGLKAEGDLIHTYQYLKGGSQISEGSAFLPSWKAALRNGAICQSCGVAEGCGCLEDVR